VNFWLKNSLIVSLFAVMLIASPASIRGIVPSASLTADNCPLSAGSVGVMHPIELATITIRRDRAAIL